MNAGPQNAGNLITSCAQWCSVQLDGSTQKRMYSQYSFYVHSVSQLTDSWTLAVVEPSCWTLPDTSQNMPQIPQRAAMMPTGF